MARINMGEVVEELDENFARVMTAVVDDLVPQNELDTRQIMRVFRSRLERGFGRWEHVPERCVDVGY